MVLYYLFGRHASVILGLVTINRQHLWSQRFWTIPSPIWNLSDLSAGCLHLLPGCSDPDERRASRPHFGQFLRHQQPGDPSHKPKGFDLERWGRMRILKQASRFWKTSMRQTCGYFMVFYQKTWDTAKDPKYKQQSQPGTRERRHWVSTREPTTGGFSRLGTFLGPRFSNPNADTNLALEDSEGEHVQNTSAFDLCDWYQQSLTE